MVDAFNKLDMMGVNMHTARALMNYSWPQYKSEQLTVTFDGATTNGIGDLTGSNNPYVMFTVTGLVEVSIIAICTTDLASSGSGTVEVGTDTSTAALIALTTATDIDKNDIWHDAAPDATIELTSVIKRNLVSEDIELLVKTGDVSAGVIVFIVKWAPISSDGLVEAV